MFTQRPSFRFLATGAAISLFVLTFLFISRSHDSGFRYILKASRPNTHSHCPSLDTSPQNKSWEFVVERDGNNHGLSEEQCGIAFPKLFGEIDKSTSLKRDNQISFKELDSRNVEDGMVRGIIDRGEVSRADASCFRMKDDTCQRPLTATPLLISSCTSSTSPQCPPLHHGPAQPSAPCSVP